MKVKEGWGEHDKVSNLLWGVGGAHLVHSSQSLPAFKMATYFPKYRCSIPGQKTTTTQHSK